MNESATRSFKGSAHGLACLLLSVVVAACGPSTPAELAASGRAHQARAEIAAAIVQYKAALQGNPALHETRMALAELLASQGEVEVAIIELDRIVAAAPQTPGVFEALSRILAVSADPKLALRRLGALKPTSPEDRATVQAQIASVWGVLGDENKAEEALRKALEIDPLNPWANLFSARRQYAKGQSIEAERTVDQLLSRRPDFAEAAYLKGVLRAAQGDEAAAVAQWQRTIAAHPGFIAAYEDLVTVSLQRKDTVEARRLLDQLRSKTSAHPTMVFIDARILVAEGSLATARERLQKLLALAPDHVGLLTLAGAVEARVGSTAQAASQLRKAVSISPELVPARSELAELEIRMGQAASALGTLKPLLAVPKPAKRHLVMASDALLRLGRAQEADVLLQRASEAAPDDNQLQAAQLLRRLQRGDVDESLLALEGLAGRSKDTYADEALVFARIARREFEPALEAILALEKKAPGQASTSELRGRVLFAQRKFDGARQAFEESLVRDPKRFSAVQALGLIDQLENKQDQAIKRLEAAVAADPKNALALVTLAEFSSRGEAKPERVVQLLGQAIAAAPNWPDPRRRLIELTIKKRQYKQALEYSRTALAAIPDDESILEVVGRAQFLSGDVEQAVKTIRRWVDAAPEAAAPQLELARIHAAQGRTEAVEAALRRAVELEPFNAVAQQAFVEHLVATRKPAEALAHVQRFRSLRPRDPMSYALLAAFQVRSKQDAAAAVTLRDGIAVTGHPELAARLFGLYARLGRDAELEAHVKSWLERNPNDMAFHYLVATREITKGAGKQAEQRLRRVVDAMPSHAAALNNLAWLVAMNGGSDALDFARRAMALSPEDAGVMDTLAFVLSKASRHDEAMALQRRAVELEPANDLLKLGLARVALAAGDKVVARKELDALHKLGKTFQSHQEVEQLMARL